MIRDALQGYSQLDLTLFAMFLFLVLFIGLVIHTFSKNQKKIFDQLQLLPLGPAGKTQEVIHDEQ